MNPAISIAADARRFTLIETSFFVIGVNRRASVAIDPFDPPAILAKAV